MAGLDDSNSRSRLYQRNSKVGQEQMGNYISHEVLRRLVSTSDVQ